MVEIMIGVRNRKQNFTKICSPQHEVLNNHTLGPPENGSSL